MVSSDAKDKPGSSYQVTLDISNFDSHMQTALANNAGYKLVLQTMGNKFSDTPAIVLSKQDLTATAAITNFQVKDDEARPDIKVLEISEPFAF